MIQYPSNNQTASPVVPEFELIATSTHPGIEIYGPKNRPAFIPPEVSESYLEVTRQ
jgi:hypothetical protein